MQETGYIRISGSRLQKLSPTKVKKIREQSWDNRFHLGKIPEYNAVYDKYLQNDLPIHKKKIILGVRRVKTRSKHSTLDLKSRTSAASEIKRIILKNQIIKKLKQNLQTVWDYKEIPEAQREIFLNAVEKLTDKKQSLVIAKEIELLKQDKNFTQLVLRAIKARENSLLELKIFAESIKVVTNEIKLNCVESLINLRMLSLHVAECIQAWRKYLHELDPQTPPNTKFTWQGQDYLSKMLVDSNFFSSTPLSTFISFHPNDPFFAKNPKQPYKIDLPLPAYLQKRIQSSEQILNSESTLPSSHISHPLPLPQAQAQAQIPTPIKPHHPATPINSKIEFVAVTGQVKSQILAFSSKVPAQVQDSMGKISNIFDHVLSLRYPAFIWALQSGQQVGLVALNLDNQKSVQSRILISHISATNLSTFAKVAESLLDYLWTSYPCLEIRVGINARINDKGKYECDPEIKSIFDKNSFRWKQMIYNQNEIPVQILGAKRQGEVDPQFSIFSDSLILSYACGLQKLNEAIAAEASICSAVGIACAYKPFIPEKFSIFSEIMIKSKSIAPAFKLKRDPVYLMAIRTLPQIGLEFKYLDQDEETSVACSSIGLSWDKFLPCVHRNIKFTKIISQINVMKSNDELVYVFMTEDPNYNVFIIPYLAGTSLKGFDKTKEVLRNMEKVDELKEIWLPDFEVRGRCHVDGVEETFSVKVATAMHPIGGFFEEPQELSAIVETRFVFGLIYQKIVEDLELPLFVFDVNKDDFIQGL